MPKFLVTYIDGRTEEVRTTLGDSVEVEQRGYSLSEKPLITGSLTVYVATQRRGQPDGHDVDWNGFHPWSRTVESLEAVENGSDPIRPVPTDGGSVPPP